MSERDKWIYELGQRHPNLAFGVSDAYIERRGKDKDEIAKLKELMIEALDFLDSGETYREQYYDEMFELVDKLREVAKP